MTFNPWSLPCSIPQLEVEFNAGSVGMRRNRRRASRIASEHLDGCSVSLCSTGDGLSPLQSEMFVLIDPWPPLAGPEDTAMELPLSTACCLQRHISASPAQSCLKPRRHYNQLFSRKPPSWLPLESFMTRSFVGNQPFHPASTKPGMSRLTFAYAEAAYPVPLQPSQLHARACLLR